MIDSSAKKSDGIIGNAIADVADDLNKLCPEMMDEDTRLDSAVAPGNGSLAYYYTMVNYATEDLDTTEFKRLLTKDILKMLLYEDEIQNLSKLHVTLVYIYLDKDGRQLSTITFPYQTYRRK